MQNVFKHLVCALLQAPRRAVIALIHLYQKISPALGPRCRFYPSCSQYAVEAFQHHGFIKGLFFTAWRLLRCQPLSRGGFDPVPLKHNSLPGCTHDTRN